MSVKTKRVVTALLAILLVLAMMISVVTPVLADDLESLEQQQEELEQQASETEALKDATQEELDAARAQLDSAKEEFAVLNQQISEVGGRIIELNGKIQENEKKLEAKEAELAQAQQDMKVHYAALKGRIQMMYESDRSSYLEILLSASSISDFFSKLEYISQVVEYDNNIMEQLDACRATIQESKEVIEATKAELVENRSQEEQEQNALLAVQAEKKEAMDNLESNELALSLMAQEQEAAFSNLMASLSANETAIQNEKDRIAAEEEAKRQEQEKNNNNNNNNSIDNGDVNDGGSNENENENGSGGGSYDPSTAPGAGDADRALPNGYYSTWPGIGNSMLSWPVDSYVLSSLYGMRIHPITGEWKSHGGIDFCADYGQSIYSCGDGVVVEANSTDEWGGGWGYYVVIQHYNGLSTLYAHCSSLNVTEGQTVSAGQSIALVGSTGQSTGSHLHLEVYSGGGRVNPEDYL